ncbi:MAG TPA: glycosyl hydrolase family 65 protein [Aggregatilineales bacterium]|nr:glycosyl hydrolase family 65 protein [Aggregatilineales bacterium]
MAHQVKATPHYKPDDWNIVEEISAWSHCQKYWYQSESIFALGNGYIGMRGTFEEGLSSARHPNHIGSASDEQTLVSVDGTYLNGFYESKVIKYPENAYGNAQNSQTMLNVPNGKIIRVLLSADGNIEPELLQVDTGRLETLIRSLNMKDGLLERRLVWESPVQKLRVELEVRRLVSFKRPHLAAIEFTLVPHFNGRIQLISILNGNVENVSATSDPRIGSHLEGNALIMLEAPLLMPEGGLLQQETKESGLMLVSGMLNVLRTETQHEQLPVVDTAHDGELSGDPNLIRVTFEVKAENGSPITLQKFLAYSYAPKQSSTASTMSDEIQKHLTEAAQIGFEELAAEQRAYMQHFWGQADVHISGRDVALLQQGIRFNMFHLLQAAGRDGRTNIGPKGLTGEGYEGHYFWDTEIFAAPFFQYAEPEVCRQLLEYRHSILENARARARILSHPRGVTYPWRTISGEECSAFFPAGTAQYHINADIAYAVKNYVATTGDTSFLVDKGAEIVFETARLWADLGTYVPSLGNAFCIHGVTGPDEYTAIVDNNCYTNLMAQENLRYAVDVAAWLKANEPERLEHIGAGLQPPLAEEEISAWAQAADAMYIPYDEQRGLFAQDDGFFNRPAWRWDWGNRDGQKVLLNRFHYLVIYRHQVCKQADVMLAFFLLPDRATLEQKRRNFDYYEPITTHDSSLSTCTYGILASEIGYREMAYAYFMQTARMDLDDSHGNVAAGVHIANMAGTWMSVVNGFAGLRLEHGQYPGDSIPHYKPYLPDEWESYSFRVRHRQHHVLKVTITRQADTVEVAYSLLADGPSLQPLKIKHHGILFELDSQNAEQRFILADA